VRVYACVRACVCACVRVGVCWCAEGSCRVLTLIAPPISIIQSKRTYTAEGFAVYTEVRALSDTSMINHLHSTDGGFRVYFRTS
jgi:hypothetical protein